MRANSSRRLVYGFGSHIFLEQYDPQTQIAPLSLVQKVADGIAQLGAQRLILSGGGVVKDGKLDAEALQRKVAGLHAAGKHCRALGLRLPITTAPNLRRRAWKSKRCIGKLIRRW
ncbi:MAG: hypothetical protein U0X75_14825 [Acidobacteriota bacterium]